MRPEVTPVGLPNRARHVRWLLGGLILLSAGGAPAQESGGPARFQISLVGETFTPAPGVPEAAVDRLLVGAARARSSGQSRVHALVQLHDIPDEAGRGQLGGDGLDLGPYASGQAWVAGLSVDRVAAAARLPQVRFLELWDANRKLHPRIRSGDFGAWTRNPDNPGWVMTFVQLHHDVPLGTLADVAAAVGGVALDPVDGLHGATVWVPEERVQELGAMEEVLWVEEGPLPLTPTNDGARSQMQADAVIAPPYNLSGTGVRLFVFDGAAVRATHETFNPGAGSRVTVIDSSPADDHPTHVAGTAAGDGSGSAAGRGRGVASSATILSAGYEQVGGTMLFWDNAGDIQADYALARNTYNADLGTNSIGSNIAGNGYDCTREGDYGVSASLLDGIVRGDNATVGSPVIMTWANGNERQASGGRCGTTYNTTGPPSCAKNPIHIGATNSDGGSMTFFSSWGPCDDGRMKPVVSAPGCEVGRGTGETSIYSSLNTSDSAYGGSCGTSMSTPAVAGVVALLVQDWRARGFGGAFARPMPALVKALLVHTARDQGLPGPDYAFGYGAVDAKGLIDTLRAGDGTLGDLTGVNWGTSSLANGQTMEWTYTVPAGSSAFRASLAWDDPAAASFAANAVVNNLNLELVAPGGTVYRAFVLDPANPFLPATTGTNVRDNQEQVLVTTPEAGSWTVRVVGASVPTGPQSFALVYSTEAPVAFPTTSTYGFEAGNDGFVLTGGAARVAAPAAGHGAFSLQFGGTNDLTQEAYRDVAIPAGTPRAELSYFWYVTSSEVLTDAHYDRFYTEVRSTAGTVLSIVDYRSDGWPRARWLQHAKVDLTPWAGQTVRIAFRATTDPSLPTTFWVDDVAVSTSPSGPTLTINDVSVVEGNVGTVNANFTVTLSPPASGPVIVTYGTTNETATAPGDYVSVTGGTLTFGAGEVTLPLSVVVNGDTGFEGNETFLVNLSNPTGGAFLGDAQGRGTIVDDDAMTCPATVNPGASFTTTVFRGSSAQDWLGLYAVAAPDSPGAPGWKYVPLPRPQTVGFTAPTTPGSYELRLFANNSYTRIGTCPFTVAVVPTLSINDVSVTEGNVGTVTANFTVTLSPTATGPVTVTYTTANQTAVAPADYAAVTNTLTFGVGVGTQPVSVVVNGDTTSEGNETFLVNLSSPTGGAVLGDGQGRATIVDDDIMTCPSPVNPGAPLNLTVSGGGSAQDWVGLYAVGAPNSPGAPGWKYVPLPRPQGVAFVAPTTPGPYEFRLFSNNSYTLLGICPITVAVVPTLNIGDVSIAEGNAGTVTANFTVTLSPTASGPVTVNYSTANQTALAPADYTSVVGGLVSFATGESTQLVSVIVNGDTSFEGNETLVVNLSNPTGGAVIGDGQGRATIVDDDALTCPATINPGAAFGATAFGGSSAQDWAGIYAVGAPDSPGAPGWKYVALPRPQTVPFSAPTTPGSYELRLFASNSYTRIGICPFTVAVVPTLTINDVSVTEGNTGSVTANFTVTLNPTAAGPVTVNYSTANQTATAPADYTAIVGATLSFATGESSQPVSVTVNGDTAFEGSETFVVNLSNPTGGAAIGDSQGRATIVDDDAMTCPATVNAGAAFTATVRGGSSAQDWLGVYTPAAPNSPAPAGWKYVPLPRPQAVTLTAPSTPGPYEIRLFATNGYTLIGLCPFTVP